MKMRTLVISAIAISLSPLQITLAASDAENYCRQRYLNPQLEQSSPTRLSLKSRPSPQAEMTLQMAPAATPPAPRMAAKPAMPSRGAVMGDADAMAPPPPPPSMNRDDYPESDPNPIKRTAEHPVSTFSADVDTASYAVVRRHLQQMERLPPADAVRPEELINAFDYDYPAPDALGDAFKPAVALFPTPWNPDHQLLRIGIQAYEVSEAERPPANLVFLLDVSGSMTAMDKLPLAKTAICMLTHELKSDDRIAMVVYAGAAGVVLEPTPAKEKSKILDAMDKLQAGGATAGGQGIELAYGLAEAHFQKNAANRIILATDGDFNVGIANPRHLTDYVARKRDTGIFLTVLGFGMGNYQDDTMQALAQNGNGVAAYIDGMEEIHRVLVRGLTASIITVAKDVKFQIEFNPARIAEYRLIGYETRMLKREDFDNDRVDAGDVGSGHQVTALYELAMTGGDGLAMQPLRYANRETAPADPKDELAFLRIRFKAPDGDTSQLIERPILPSDSLEKLSEAPEDARFATAVAWFAQALKNDPRVESDWRAIADLANGALGEDPWFERAEFVELVRDAARIDGRQ